MSFTRHRRRWLSANLLVALLFMQWVTVVHACPVLSSPQPQQPAMAMAMMPGCDGHLPQASDVDHLQQCKAHCEQARQVVDSTPGVGFDTPPVILLALVDWAHAARVTPLACQVEPVVRSGAAPPGSLPLYLSLLVLRN